MKVRHGILIGVASSLLMLLLVFALLMASGAALAQRGDPPEAASPPGAGAPPDAASLAPQAGASYYHIPAYVLIPGSPVITVSHDNFGCIHLTAGDELPLYAALDIPPASRIVSFTVFYYDTSVGDVSGSLVQYNSAGTSAVNLASISSAAVPATTAGRRPRPRHRHLQQQLRAARVPQCPVRLAARLRGARHLLRAHSWRQFHAVMTKNATAP